MRRKELGCTTEDLARAPSWRLAERPLLGSLPARGPFTSKTSAHSSFLFTLPFSPLLSASGFFFETRSVPTIGFFFGAVNPERDLNFKEQLPRRRTCRLNARFSLAADGTDSVCRLPTLLRALFATLRNVCLFARGSVIIFFYFFKSVFHRSRASHWKPLDPIAGSYLSTFQHIRRAA